MHFIDKCFRRLADLTDSKGVAGDSISRASSGHITNPDLCLQAIERLLLLAQRYISIVEVSNHQVGWVVINVGVMVEYSSH